MTVRTHLKRLIEDRATLTRDEARDLMHLILTGAASDAEIAAILGALASRGETPEELAGFVDSMRAAATPLPLTDAERATLVDTCGTGGDHSGTFNISTAAALVAAAAGARVAKHGNRAVTSRCGSGDVLEALGIPINLAPAQAAESLRRHGFAFLLASNHHPAMRAVMPIRKALGVRTVFNLIGPMTNPAGAPAQVMGVYSPRLVPLVAEALLLLNTRHALVVHGAGGMDELSLSGPTHVAEVHHGAVTLSQLSPQDAGLPPAGVDTLQGADASTNAAILRSLFAGTPGPPRDVTLLNAAAVLVTAGLTPDIPRGVTLAAQAIDSGAVTKLVNDLAAS